MKIVAITPDTFAGNIEKNCESIINAVNSADAELVILPLFAVTGEILDLSFFPNIIKKRDKALKNIAARINTPVVLGLNETEAAVLEKGKCNYLRVRERYELACGKILAVGTTFDLENATVFPFECDIIAIPSAYPALVGGLKRKECESNALASKNNAVVAVSCAKDGSFNYVRAGHKIVANPIKDYILPPLVPSFMPKVDEIDEVFEILGRGLIQRMHETMSSKVILGVSGGLDSAFVLVAAALIFDRYKLPRTDIMAVMMPASASSERTKGNAAKLIELLGVTGIEIPINRSVCSHLKVINHKKKDVVYENAQARRRAHILMDLGNKFGALVLGTTDMFEIALGFSTYGGDRLAHYNIINSLTKSTLRFILNALLPNFDALLASVIEDILATPISPELKKNQRTEEILGDVRLHEFFLLCLIGYKESGAVIRKKAAEEFKNFSPVAIEKYYNIFVSRFCQNQFKARFACDGIRLFPFDLASFCFPLSLSPLILE